MVTDIFKWPPGTDPGENLCEDSQRSTSVGPEFPASAQARTKKTGSEINPHIKNICLGPEEPRHVEEGSRRGEGPDASPGTAIAHALPSLNRC